MRYKARHQKEETTTERFTSFLHQHSKVIGSIIGAIANLVIAPLTMIGAMVIANHIESSDTSVFGTLMIWTMVYLAFIGYPLTIGIRRIVMNEIQHQVLKHIQY